MTEVWRPVVGHPGYEVSHLGRVRSVDRVVSTKRGPRRYTGKVLTPALRVPREGADPYEVVHLGTPGSGPRPHHYVHELVATAFLGPRPDGLECCHFNGCSTDNRVENLRWDTRKANAADMVRHGRAGRRKRGAA